VRKYYSSNGEFQEGGRQGMAGRGKASQKRQRNFTGGYLFKIR